jgi:ABC-2 type transport system ATP-binding protein
LALHDGLTVFVSSHLLSEIQAIGTRVGILVEGELRAEGRVQDLLARGDKAPRVQISALDPKALKRCVAEHPGAEIVEEDSHGSLDVRLVTGSVPELVRAMVDQNISLTRVVPQERSLEDAFLELTS